MQICSNGIAFCKLIDRYMSSFYMSDNEPGTGNRVGIRMKVKGKLTVQEEDLKLQIVKVLEIPEIPDDELRVYFDKMIDYLMNKGVIVDVDEIYENEVYIGSDVYVNYYRLKEIVEIDVPLEGKARRFL